MAARYAVNTPFNWDGTAGTKWATSSGGSGGASVPTSADDVFVDAASGSGAITISTGNTGCRDLNTTGFTGNIAGSVAITISGSLTIGSGSTFTSSSSLTFNATSAKTITTNGKTIGGNLVFNGVAGAWQLQDNLATNSRTLTLTNGTLDLNGKDLSGSSFSSSSSNTRVIITGTGGSITCSGNNSTVLSGATLTNLTITGTLLVKLTYALGSGTRTVTWGSTAGSTIARAIDLNITAGSDFILINSGQFGSLNLTGFAGTIQSTTGNLLILGSVTLGTSTTWASNGNMTYNNTSGTQVLTTNGRTMTAGNTVINGVGTTLQIAGNSTLGNVTLTNGTLDLNGKALTAATFSANNTNTRVIVTGSGGKFILTATSGGVLNVPNLTGLTITGSLVIDVTNASASGPRSLNWGASSSGNLSAKAPDLNITAGADSVAIQGISWFRSINYTGFSGNNASSGDTIISGNLIISTGMTYSGSADLYFQGDSGTTQQITSNGKTIPGSVFLDGPGATYQFMDDLSAGTALYLDHGTLDFNAKNATAEFFAVNATGTQVMAMGASLLTLTGDADAFHNLEPAGFSITYSAGAKISMTSASAKQFFGAGFSYPVLSQDGAGALTISDANTFADIQRTAAGDVLLVAGITTTLAALTLGSSGAFRSDTAGVPSTISKASGTVTIDNTTVKDVTATGGATFNAFTANGNTDGGGNTGWNFTSGGAGTYTLACALGSFALNGQVALFKLGRKVTADVGSYALSGQVALLRLGRKVTGDVGSYALTGQPATLRATRTMPGALGSYALSGQVALLKLGHKVTADVGSYVLTGQLAGLRIGRKVTGDVGTFTVTGQVALFKATRTMPAAKGDYALNGQPAVLRLGHSMPAAFGSYALNGQPAILKVARKASADVGSYTLTGQPALMARTRVLQVAFGSFTMTGQQAGLNKGSSKSLLALFGSYAVNGQDVTLRTTRVMPAAKGDYTVTGQIAGLRAQRVLVGTVGNYVLTGQNVVFRATRLMPAGKGDYALNGQVALFVRGRRLVAGLGSYALTGQIAGLNKGASSTLTALFGSYAVNGQPVGLRVTRLMPADKGDYALAGQLVSLKLGRKVLGALGTYALTGQPALLSRTRVLKLDGGSYLVRGQSALLTFQGVVVRHRRRSYGELPG